MRDRTLMRFGCLCEVEEMSALANAGYGFAETGAAVLYAALEEGPFREARQRLLAEPLFAEVVRVPGLLDGDEAPELALTARDLFRRAALVGAKVLVAQAPPAPREESARSEAWRGLVETLGLLSESGARNGVALAIAPVRQGSLAETLEEAWVLTQEVGHPTVGIAADLGTVREAADLAAGGPAIKHVWLPLPRRYGGEADTTTCFEALGDLAEMGYHGRVSVSAAWPALGERAGDLLEELTAYGRGTA
jgi:hypothetical protein